MINWESVVSNTAISGFFISIISFLINKRIESKFELIKEKEIENLKYKLTKDLNVFEREKESLSEILNEIYEMNIYINSTLNYEKMNFPLIDESKIDNFELKMAKNILFLDEVNKKIIDFVIMILRKNSTFIMNVVGDNDLSIEKKDLVLLKYIQDSLVITFRNQLFEKDNSIYYSNIKYIEISYYITKLVEDGIYDFDTLKPFMYTVNPIGIVIKNINSNRIKLLEILNEFILDSKKDVSITDQRYLEISSLEEFVKYLEIKM